MKKVWNIFFDRDGTLIEDKHYLSNPRDLVLLPNVGLALEKLIKNGCHLFLVSNQSGVGRGLFTETSVLACHKELTRLLAGYGVFFTDALWCVHAPSENCDCRKPKLGMWKALSQKHRLTASETIMIGDKCDDISFGVKAEFLASILVKTGKGEQEAIKCGYRFPEKGCAPMEVTKNKSTCILTTQSIMDAVSWILQE
ncbi:HAD-IIIA family hydrolase [Lawsonia intracellularis]|uniref:D,D-heptose 1,7-bisphosphate phosphatase n=1 Tax=Lawsonia intracellularis (strain PHE/MN1-00) TaxID=363253 RepID=Q1MS39_LAWIP|nr:HAD-IIIA family hydrolase [Lawsonia intracellularis]AGC49530.1 histidinol phosphatase phosphatase family protein [Lawsonia intracellularis N343]KAA0205051.1 HAD family hydrolase [Lawsonia intracellularis]MBZ3892423.1 HAD-IIIA family hydrolase [Lawsonia intracellularis]OMQ06192.1 HAD family hydrolase [Lawsonia intracellularis]RBN32400.1 HAD-IIIA family hydrolase [Lawsonia intracellularis]